MERQIFLNNQLANYDSYRLPVINIFHYIYDFIVFLIKNFPHKEANKEVNRLCKKFGLKRKIVLDIGSYTGYKSFYFYAARNIVFGIDQSSNVHKYALKRYRFYKIHFILGELIDVMNNQISDGSIDFIHCNVMPLHYDTGDVTTSEYITDVLLLAYKKLKTSGILYYTFYTIQSKKVAYPISIDALKILLQKLAFSDYQIDVYEKNRFNNPVIECVIRRG